MATDGSIQTIAAGTALIDQLMVLGWVDLIIIILPAAIVWIEPAEHTQRYASFGSVNGALVANEMELLALDIQRVDHSILMLKQVNKKDSRYLNDATLQLSWNVHRILVCSLRTDHIFLSLSQCVDGSD